MIVVDVNVVAYLLIEGRRTATAEGVLTRDPQWSAPLLWRSEWCSVLSVYLRRGDLALPAALELVREAERLLEGREFLPDAARVLALVEGSSCSAYDCEYVALAAELAVPLVTADRQVLDSFPDTAIAPAEFAA